MASQKDEKIKPDWMFHLLKPGAKVPFRGSKFSAGFDLFALLEKKEEHLIIKSGETVKIPTGIALTMPVGMFGKIHDRSGMALKQMLVGGGVIDCDYTGEILVVLHNLGKNNFTITSGDRIAQIIFQKYEDPTFTVTDQPPEATLRGKGGFGSTGLK